MGLSAPEEAGVSNKESHTKLAPGQGPSEPASLQGAHSCTRRKQLLSCIQFPRLDALKKLFFVCLLSLDCTGERYC